MVLLPPLVAHPVVEASVLALNWPWWLILLPLPLLLRWMPARQRLLQRPLHIASLPHLSPQAPQQDAWTHAGAWLAWCLLLLALARPVWHGEPIPLDTPYRDILLAVDLSDSMRTRDMQQQGQSVSRLAVVKAQLHHFIAQRAGDRMGLILFADHAYTMAPLTNDWQTLQSFVDELDFSMAGSLTALGEGIDMAIARSRLEGSQQRLLVLLSDGRETVGIVDPYAAIQRAQAAGLRIYSIGFGAEPLDQVATQQTDLDEPLLQAMAHQTGGQYFRARDPDALAHIYQEINRLEPRETGQRPYYPRTELFSWPLAAMALLVLMLLWRIRQQHG